MNTVPWSAAVVRGQIAGTSENPKKSKIMVTSHPPLSTQCTNRTPVCGYGTAAAARGQIAGTSENPKKSKKNWKKLKVVDRICFN